MCRASILLIICFFFSHVNGQVVSDIQSSELDKFAEIYLLSKTLVVSPDSIITAILDEKKITTNDYAANLKGETEQHKMISNPNVAKLTESMNVINNHLEDEKESRTRQICTQIGMEYKRYTLILAKYKSEPLFQNSLRPYFAKLIE